MSVQTMPIRIFLTLFILFLIHPSILQSAPEQRTALVIGNNIYSSGPLKNPVNDATDMAVTLQKLGFKVILKKNANLETMDAAIEDFGNQLKKGGVGLFYYAGHGVQVNGVNYLIPIGAKINKESDVRFKAFDAGRVLAEMENANNGLNIVLLDACRDNPFGKSFRTASRGLAIVSSAPAGTIISYSTGPGQVARDGEGRNSPYTKALLQYVQEPGLTIEDVFKGVRQKLRKETGQVPWELSSLEGKFYFRPARTAESASVVGTPAVDYDAERRKIEEERELLRQKAALEEERRKLEEEKQQLAMAKPSSVLSVIETGRDDRFINNGNKTVTDTKTGLMWAAEGKSTYTKWVDGPNGKILLTSWAQARSYCENYRGGGYTDWRMPTQDELAGLHDKDKTYETKCFSKVHLSALIHLPCVWVWASETRDLDLRKPCLSYESCPGTAALFSFGFSGKRHWDHQFYDGGTVALPVRTAK